MRALVTGGNGFVGRALVAYLRNRGDSVIVTGHAHDRTEIELDVRDGKRATQVVAETQPEVILHLAGIAFIPQANDETLLTYETNVIGTANMLAAARASKRLRCFVYVSSAEVYGPRAPAEYPMREGVATRPHTPYAASKVAAEAIVTAEMRTFGTPAIVTRAFNIIGPGQDERFVIPAFAKQLAAIKNGAEPVMYVGNLDAKRDFVDVRDVARAYAAVADRGEPGKTYNVCSGRAVAIKECLRLLIGIARVPVEVREDPERMRPSDLPLSCGDPSKLREATGWEPQISLEGSLRDIFDEACEYTVVRA